MIETPRPLAPALWATVPVPEQAPLLRELATLRRENAALRAQNAGLQEAKRAVDSPSGYSRWASPAASKGGRCWSSW